MEYLEQYFHTPTSEEKASSVYITWAGHRVCSSDYAVGPGALENYKLILVLKGKGFLKQEGNVFYLRAGDMFTLFPGVKHFYYSDPDDPWELIWVSFNGGICEQTLESINLTPEQPVISNALIHTIVSTLKKILNGLDSKDDPFVLKSTGNLYILFSEMKTLCRENKNVINKTKTEDIVNKALLFIQTNYYLALDVDSLCNYVNYSRSFFSRLFKKGSGHDYSPVY